MVAYKPRPCVLCGALHIPLGAKTKYCSVRCLVFSRIDSSGGLDACWPFMGPRVTSGYGTVRRAGANVYTHRFMCEQVCGPMQPGHYACHSCDNPPCCNPSHLFAGTPTDNVVDMYSKGRQGERDYATGDRHGMRIKKKMGG